MTASLGLRRVTRQGRAPAARVLACRVSLYSASLCRSSDVLLRHAVDWIWAAMPSHIGRPLGPAAKGKHWQPRLGCRQDDLEDFDGEGGPSRGHGRPTQSVHHACRAHLHLSQQPRRRPFPKSCSLQVQVQVCCLIPSLPAGQSRLPPRP